MTVNCTETHIFYAKVWLTDWLTDSLTHWQTDRQKDVHGAHLKKNLEGYPHFGPLIGVAHKNEHPRTPYDPFLLLKNPVPLWIWGCLQKKTDLNTLRFDPDIRVLSLKKSIYKIFLKNSPLNKKFCKSARFPDFFDFFFCLVRSWSISLYMGQHWY